MPVTLRYGAAMELLLMASKVSQNGRYSPALPKKETTKSVKNALLATFLQHPSNHTHHHRTNKIFFLKYHCQLQLDILQKNEVEFSKYSLLYINISYISHKSKFPKSVCTHLYKYNCKSRHIRKYKYMNTNI